MPKPNDFIKISAQEIKRRQSFIDLFDDIAIDTTQIYHIDVDMMPEKKQYPDCNWKFLDRIRTTLPYYESVTKKMPHAFVKASTKLKKTRQQILYDDIEILSGCYAFCKKNEIVHNSHVPLVAFDIETYFEPARVEDVEDIEFECEIGADMSCSSDGSVLNSFLEIIDVKYIDSYDSWYKLGTAIYNCGGDKQTFNNLSKRSKKYGGVDKLWSQLDNMGTLKAIGFGTICYYAKLSDPERFEYLRVSHFGAKKTELDKLLDTGVLTHDSVSKIFYEQYKGVYQYCDSHFYEINHGGILVKLYKDSETIIAREIKRYIQGHLLRAIDSETDDDKRKKLWKAERNLETYSFKMSCFNEMKQDFLNRSLISEMDNNPMLIGFNNGIYDLRDHHFRKGNFEDKVSMTTGNDFVEAVSQVNIDFFDDLFDNYFRCTATSGYFKKHLGSLLEGGNKEQKCYFWCGNGRNGKGTTDQLLKSVLGQYYTELSNEFFTLSKKDGDRPEPEVLKLRHKRISMTHEPEGSVKYLTSKFKRLSGGDALVARGLYDTHSQSFTPTNKPIIQTNHLPEFTDVDDGLQQRLVVIEFPYKFLDPNNFDESNPSHKRIDLELGQKIKSRKNDFMHFLIKYYKIYKSEGLLDLPFDIKSSINSYRKDIDSVKTFCEEALQSTNNDKDKISVTELLCFHNNWTENGLSPQKFNKRLNAVGYTTEKCRLNGTPISCIKGYKWNHDFVDLNDDM
jgi:P4 family phage/plasmid primase-like protien